MLHETPRNLGNIALLIDADNSQCTIIDKVIEILSQYGKVIYRYAYGNWIKLPHLQLIMDKNAIKPQYVPERVKGKNAADIELVGHTWKMVYKENFPIQTFCIVAGDSDYTSFISDLRMEGKFVIGIGKKQTPQCLVDACDEFIYIEDIEQGVYHPPQPIPTQPSPKPSPKKPKHAKPLIQQALAQLQNPTEWVHLDDLGNVLKKSNFQSGDYGHKKLLTLIKALPHHFAIKKQGTIVYVSLKKDAQ